MNWLTKRRIVSVFNIGSVVAMCTVLVFFGLQGCEGDPNKARDLVESQGFTQVEVDGTDARGCGGEGQSNAFTALAPNGKRVQGVVCCSVSGCAKGCTLRWR